MKQDIPTREKIMNRYRKKPVVINALQWTGNNVDEMIKFSDDSHDLAYNSLSDKMTIDTLEGTMTASKGDWIIKGTAGEFYPCKPDIFKAVYEKVDDENVK